MRVQSLSIFESNATSLKPSSAQKLQLAATAEFLFSTPMGSVLALGGIDGVSLRALLDQVDHGPDHQRALLVRIESASAAEEIVERVIDLLADTALRLWPLWFTDISFAECRSDTLGRAAARIIARQAAETIDGLSHPWRLRRATWLPRFTATTAQRRCTTFPSTSSTTPALDADLTWLARYTRLDMLLHAQNMADCAIKDTRNRHSIDGILEVMVTDRIGDPASLHALASDPVYQAVYARVRTVRNKLIGHMDRAAPLAALVAALDALPDTETCDLVNMVDKAVHTAARSHIAIWAQYSTGNQVLDDPAISSIAGIQTRSYY
jgi:hypothetical protein